MTKDSQRWVKRNGNGIIIEFMLNRARYSFAPIRKGRFEDPIALGKAVSIAKRIEFDIIDENFDPTLERYRIGSKIQKPQKIAPVAIETKLLKIWDKWVKQLDASPSAKNSHYKYCRSMIAKVDPEISDASWFLDLKERYSSETYNERLQLIKSCMRWAITQKLIDDSPWEKIKPKKRQASRVKPFSKDEVNIIIRAFESDQFVPQKSAYSHSHYANFVKFLFATGCRIGEAIGLRWKHIDFERNLIEIAVSASIDPQTHKRVQKATKTEEIRYLPLNEYLKEILIKPNGANGENLVFPNYLGGYIDSSNFRDRIWRKVLEGLAIEYRYPYQMRHTALSHIAMESNLPMAAKVAGHKNLIMVQKHYAKFIGDIELPKY